LKILVTGATGFVGTNLLPELVKEGHEVYGIDNFNQSEYNYEFHKDYKKIYCADITDREKIFKIFNEVKPDKVFHFAGLVSIYDCNREPHIAVRNNIEGSINVIDASLNSGCNRVIFSETSAVYENCELPENGYIETQSDPTTIYAVTKASIALFAKSYARLKGLKYTALRYFNIAGPVQDYRRTVPPLFAGVALRLLGGNNPIIFGDGTRRRDFIHVDDINKFHLMCINPKYEEKTINETFNLGTGKSHSLFEIGEIVYNYLKSKNLLKGIYDKKLEFDIYPEINGEAHTIFANIEKAKSICWKPEKTIEDQIKDTIDYLLTEIEEGNVNPKTFMTDLDPNEVKIG